MRGQIEETSPNEAAGKPSPLPGRIMGNMGTRKCQHHWLIEAADGPVSLGVCKLCQLVREFTNTVGVDKWGYFRLSKGDAGKLVE